MSQASAMCRRPANSSIWNSLFNVSVALNMDNFSQKHQVASGANWDI